MMVVDYGRGEGNVIVQQTGAESKIVAVEEKKLDARQPLWDKLDEAGISYKKNMSKAKLEELLEE